MNTSSIPFSLLSLETTLDLAIRCSAVIATRNAKENLLVNALAGLEGPIERAKLAISDDNKKELTEERNKADDKRDKIFIGLRKRIEAELYNVTNPAAQEAAKNLLEIIAKHGNRLHVEGMSVQSARLVALFKDLESDSAKADLATLGLDNLLDKLKQAQSEFAAIQQQRSELESAEDIPTKEEARVELVGKLIVLFKGLDFLSADQPKDYSEMASQVQTIADELVASERIRNRTSDQSSGKGESELPKA